MIEPHIPIVRELERQMRRDGARAPGTVRRARDRASARAPERRPAAAAPRAAGPRGVVPERRRGALGAVSDAPPRNPARTAAFAVRRVRRGS